MLWILAAIYLVCVLVLARALLRAPEGFEDERGFHQGRNPVVDDSQPELDRG